MRSSHRHFGFVGLALVGAMSLPLACDCSGKSSAEGGVGIGGQPAIKTVPTTVRSDKYVITDLSLGMGGDAPGGAPPPTPAPGGAAPAPAAGQPH
jgi:hypothetical protein